MKKPYYGYIVAAASFLIWFAAWGTFSTFSIFLKPISIETGWTRTDLSLAFSISSFVQAVCALAMGRLTDKFGPSFLVTVFGSFIAVSFLLLSQVSTIFQFQIAYALIGGIGLSTATIPIMTTIARWFSKRRGTLTGIVQSGMGIGGLVFAPLTGWLILNYDWQTAYMIIGLIILPIIFISGILLKKNSNVNLEIDNEQTGISKNSISKDDQNDGFTLVQALKTRQFWMIAGMFFSFGFCRATFLAHTAAHVQDMGYSLGEGANTMALLTFSSVLGRIGVGILGDKIGSRNVYLMTYIVMLIALISGKITNSLLGIFLFAILFGFSWGGQAVLRFTFTAEKFGLVALGVITGALGLMEAGAAALGSFIAGYVFDLVGSYEIMFTVGIVLSISGGLMLYLIKPIKR